MTKYPKAWIDAIENQLVEDSFIRERDKDSFWGIEYLKVLDKLGALKEIPQPREIWWCPKCKKELNGETFGSRHITHTKCNTRAIKMREVIDE